MSNMELPFVLAYEPEYEDKVARLSKEEFFSLFEHLNAAPRWVNSNGKRAIQILGLCHHGENHSALFDPETLKVNCFSACGGGMMLHTWVMRALDLSSPYYSRKAIEKWIDGQGLDLAHRAPRGGLDFSFYEKPFDPDVEIEMVKGIDPTIIRDLYSGFDTTRETLSRLVWCKNKEQGGDGIPVEQLEAFQVAYNPKRKTIILPHHNANGEIVGLYERNFAMLRQEAKERFPDFSPKDLVQFPTAKYFPLFKGEKYRKSGKPCWSFPNSQNLYGLHKAKEAIRETGKAIIFEGAKSVMLAHAYGYPYAVATHTFGAHTNHIAMLMQAGAKEIILAFDKQYEDCKSKEWELFEMKTKGLAERVGAHVAVSRVCDKTGFWLDYKDAPIDQGKMTFDLLFKDRETLTAKE